MAMSMQQIIDKLKQRGVTDDVIQQLSQMAVSETAGSFDGTSDPAIVKAYYNKISEALEKHKDQLEDVVNVEEESLATVEDEMEVLRLIIDNELKAEEQNQDRLTAAQRRYKELLEIKKQKEKFLRGMEKGDAAAEQLMQATFGLSREWEGLASKQGMKGLTKGFAGGLKNMLHPMNILMSIAQKIFERAVAYDKASADLFKRTGIDKSQINLKEMATGLKGMSVDLEQKVAKSVGDLQEGFRSIGELGTDQLKTTAQTITVLEAFGANSANTVETFGILTKTLGQTPEQANMFLNNVTAIAGEISRPPSELLSDFVKAAPILARFGNESEKVFKDITYQATLLEMDVAQLVGLSEGMDTFEGAAKAAQAFNVAVGQPFLSAQALLAADPAQKLQLIADAYDRAGRTPLAPRMMRALASDLGVNPAELQRILKVSTSGLESKRTAMDTAQATMAENIQKAQENQTAMDRITAMMQRIIDGFIEITDLDEGLGKAAGLFTKVSQFFLSDKDDEYKKNLELRKKLEKQGGAVYGTRVTNTGQVVSEIMSAQEAERQQAINSGYDKLARMYQEGAITRNSIEGTFQLKGKMGKEAVDDLVKQTGLNRRSIVEFMQGRSPGFDAAQKTDLSFVGPAQEVESDKLITYASFVPDSLAPQNDAMATPMSLSSNYVQPVFNKKDKFYAAKDGGAIANALDEVLDAVDKLIEEKRDVNLDINERRLAQAVDNAFSTIQRRTV